MFWVPAYQLKITYEGNNKYMHNEIQVLSLKCAVRFRVTTGRCEETQE